MNLLVDKYRPTEFEDVLGNKDTIQALSSILITKNMPHLLLTGPPGTGKTTCARIICNKLVSKEDSLELNASDERGIDVIRTTIKYFAQKQCKSIFKIIILDEADSMTQTAQQGLRRIMELCNNTRFILICNTFSKIFEPIQSRCAIIRFEFIKDSEQREVLTKICENEKISLDDLALETLLALSDGDMRQSLNILQSLSNFPLITEEMIAQVTGNPSPKQIHQIIDCLKKKELESALLLFEEIWEEKYDQADIVSGFFRVAKQQNDYQLMKLVGDLQFKVCEGINSKLQFLGLLADIFESCN